ncbi:MAG: tetratricopeptide repeat protein, partial [SAR324 cluster bacterium]|nr:tetratricopeptide repeat protein [SAR324 cluster bacterium]
YGTYFWRREGMKRSLAIASWALVFLFLAAPAWAGSPTAAEAFNKGVSFYDAGRFEDAAKWLRMAAERGNADAQHILGVIYQSGQGVPQDNLEAAKWYLKAAERGQVIAQFNLGVMYDQGLGVRRDYSKAAKWFRKAAGQGNADAQFNLGLMNKLGRGVPEDYSAAVRWFQKAADQGQDKAQLNLGVMYANGEGIPRDYVQAHMWFNLAAHNGLEVAEKNRDIIATEMTPRQIAKAQRLAREWKPKKEPGISQIELSIQPKLT